MPWQYRFTISVSSWLRNELKTRQESAAVGGPKV